MRFTQAYCAQSICSPSRAALLTGKTPARLHLTTYLPGRADCSAQKLLHPKMRQQLPLEEQTLAERLKDSGYATACVGKWHLGGKGFLPTDQGFDFYHPGEANTKPSETEGGKGEYDLTSAAIRFITTNAARPFFLYLPHNNPHIPYTARTNLIAKNSQALEPVYAAVIEELDASVGKLLAKLDELQLTEKTIVIFTSDNGGLHVPEGPHKIVTHNTPYRAGKGYMYEGGLRIPLIVRWPGKIPAWRTNDIPVINTDWTPTLCAIAGARTTQLDGLDIGTQLFARTQPVARKLFWHFPHYTNQGGRPAGAVRDGDWKLILNYEDDSTELYNLATDIGETNNLAAQQPARVNEMKKTFTDWRTSVSAQLNTTNPTFDAEAHAAIYKAYDSSKYNASTATATDRDQIQTWRKLMNAALRQR
jgi:arylsulfatase A-like enzyme